MISPLLAGLPVPHLSRQQLRVSLLCSRPHPVTVRRELKTQPIDGLLVLFEGGIGQGPARRNGVDLERASECQAEVFQPAEGGDGPLRGGEFGADRLDKLSWIPPRFFVSFLNRLARIFHPHSWSMNCAMALLLVGFGLAHTPSPQRARPPL